MASPLFGKWKLGKSENFDEYMKAVGESTLTWNSDPKKINFVSFLPQTGVNIALRKMGALVSATSEITDEGDGKIRIDTQSTFKSANVLFTIGAEIDESTMDGRSCKVDIICVSLVKTLS